MAKPHAHQNRAAIEKLVRILAIPVPAFFPREKPISRKAKPACMNITSTPATITQVVLTLDVTSSRVGPPAADANAGTARSVPAQAPSPRAILFRYLLR